MSGGIVLSDLDVLRIAELAVERRRARLEWHCSRLSPENRALALRCRELEEGTLPPVFKKRDFITAYHRYAKRTGLYVKIETLLRKLRRLAKEGRYIAYYNGRKGVYIITARNT